MPDDQELSAIKMDVMSKAMYYPLIFLGASMTITGEAVKLKTAYDAAQIKPVIDKQLITEQCTKSEKKKEKAQRLKKLIFFLESDEPTIEINDSGNTINVKYSGTEQLFLTKPETDIKSKIGQCITQKEIDIINDHKKSTRYAPNFKTAFLGLTIALFGGILRNKAIRIRKEEQRKQAPNPP